MNKQEWHADLHIDEHLIKKILGEQFSNLTIEKIQFLAEGWDNRAYLINEQFIFRFPRRQVAIELIDRENKLLTNVSSFFDLAIPTPEFIGKPSEAYPSSFQGYKIIQGTPAYLADLSLQERLDSLSVLANFLKSLHSIDEKQALQLGAQEQVFNRTEVTKLMSVLRERVSKIIDQKIVLINENVFNEEMAATNAIKLDFSDRCLVHGDLDYRHLLFDKKQLIGVIDWGDVGINNRAVDLAIIWNFYPMNSHARFFRIYGNVDQEIWKYARFLALYCAFIHILYGHDIADIKLVTEAISSIQQINDKLLVE